MARILVTPRSLTSDPPPALERLRAAGFELVFSTPGETPDEPELMRLVPGCAGWLAGVEPVSEAVIASADALRVISRNGSGIDSLPLSVLEKRCIAVERAMGANATGVAELATVLMLAAFRHLPETAAGVRGGGWPRLRGREVEGATVGIVGMGAIGRKVAATMTALGARVLAHDPLAPEVDLSALRYVPLERLLREADVVTLHCPMPAGGGAMIDARVLEAMRPGAVVVNTARAGLVDEPAMLAALEAERIGCYATDVFAEEPPRDRTLAAHPGVIATSHIGGLTEGSVTRATEMAVENLLKHLAVQDD